MNIYIGNLSQEVTEADLRGAFEAFGGIATINIISDRHSGESRGFAFVEMSSKEEALSAITGLNGTELNGKTIDVNEARPRAEKQKGGSSRF